MINILLLYLAINPLAQEAKKHQMQNYHWRADGCTICHDMKEGKPVNIPSRTKIDQMCLSCHDGIKASYELHPVGVTFKENLFKKPADWPLNEKNRIGCLTCHDVLLLSNRDKTTLPVTNPWFLRGKQGGDIPVFCANCHKSMPYQNAHPHIMLRPDNSVHKENCLLCHTKVMDRSAIVRTGKPELRSKEIDLCRSCHSTHVDYFEPGHIGIKIPQKMLAYITACEKTGSTKPELMVPDKDGKVLCSTCHNPHQKGLFPKGSRLAFNALIVKYAKITSLVRTTEFCRRCHNK